ncbi:GNAT family N-acetyltransferase [Lapillicoccus jejuensis]|uniref:GNAT family N-acetyltransferase n=1 Tax=Lapillicoccus jejuensis TaxID=402171 RepID=UPI003CCC8515
MIGQVTLRARDFAVTREVSTGSWLGLGHHRQGYGTEARTALLALAFDHLGRRDDGGVRGQRGVAGCVAPIGLPARRDLTRSARRPGRRVPPVATHRGPLGVARGEGDCRGRRTGCCEIDVRVSESAERRAQPVFDAVRAGTLTSSRELWHRCPAGESPRSFRGCLCTSLRGESAKKINGCTLDILLEH